jgi:hypothetical protein
MTLKMCCDQVNAAGGTEPCCRCKLDEIPSLEEQWLGVMVYAEASGTSALIGDDDVEREACAWVAMNRQRYLTYLEIFCSRATEKLRQEITRAIASRDKIVVPGVGNPGSHSGKGLQDEPYKLFRQWHTENGRVSKLTSYTKHLIRWRNQEYRDFARLDGDLEDPNAARGSSIQDIIRSRPNGRVQYESYRKRRDEKPGEWVKWVRPMEGDNGDWKLTQAQIDKECEFFVRKTTRRFPQPCEKSEGDGGAECHSLKRAIAAAIRVYKLSGQLLLNGEDPMKQYAGLEVSSRTAGAEFPKTEYMYQRGNANNPGGEADTFAKKVHANAPTHVWRLREVMPFINFEDERLQSEVHPYFDAMVKRLSEEARKQ